MFTARAMQPKDYGFAVALANTMDWHMAKEDFEFNSSLEPQGCLLLYDNSAPVGLATCLSYGKVGWFGNLIVSEQVRHRGAGSFLVNHAIEFLHQKGVQSIGLYAYPHLVDFYGKLGFKADVDFTYLHAANLPKAQADRLPELTAKDFSAIEAFDRKYFGGDRSRLLKVNFFSESSLAFFVSEEGKVVGYASANVYEGMAEVAPLVCKPGRFDVAHRLLNAILSQLGGSDVYLCLPKEPSPLTESLVRLGFKEEIAVKRMFHGINPIKNCIYLAESLERG
jgi:predicted N-acetyltransferase YhbS